MKRIVCLLLFCVAELHAADADQMSITVEGTRLDDVSGEEVKSADVAEALVKKVPSISLVRRSGIANDIILRGQKKDNINILIDGAKIYGACPNRMDPPTSHVLANNIEGIEITEGPYDVENFGTLSGAVKITTKKPSKEFEGEVSLNLGSWGYRKYATTFSGGGDKARVLLSLSKESGGQYEDGDGNDFFQRQVIYNTPAGNRYKDIYSGIDAYDKRTFMGKIFIDIAENQELALSYTANRSDDVLYPATPMDALYDDSDILNLDYSIKNLSAYSKSLDIQLYDSRVDHPMSTSYRNASGAASVNEVISALTTKMQGIKIKNAFDLNGTTELNYGLDISRRNWDGVYSGGPGGVFDGRISIDDTDTTNRAVFVEVEKRVSDLSLKVGARYDDTSIEPAGNNGQPSNDYSALSAFVFGTYQKSETTKFFGGVGKASRVPDARELYFFNKDGVEIGTPDLDQTTNYEIDFGVEHTFENLTVKTKLFHSWLKDYIYFNSTSVPKGFENIDATIYGLDITGSYFFTDDIYLDFGLAYQRGRKDHALTGQTDRDLAEIPPLKANIAVNYDYGSNNTARVELVAADSWSSFDGDNGEQALGSYAVINMKLQHMISQHFELTAGIDNLFDKTYAVSNTYKDLTLIQDPAEEVMLMNEPGRYFYLNAVYKF